MLLAGLLADVLGIPAAIGAIGGLAILSGVIVTGTMYETLPAGRGLAIPTEAESG